MIWSKCENLTLYPKIIPQLIKNKVIQDYLFIKKEITRYRQWFLGVILDKNLNMNVHTVTKWANIEIEYH